jgi:Interferon-induced transmembrane protein
MADETGPPRSKYPPPKPPSPTPNPPQARQAQQAPPAAGYPQQPGYQQQPQPGYQQQPQPGYQQQPGYGPGRVRAPAQPSAYWPLSIISFICFFLVGLVAIYFSAQVGTRWRAGNVQGAEKASRMALIWSIVGIAIGLVVFFAAIGNGSGTSY